MFVDFEFITRMLVGNLSYLLLVVSMTMTRMLALRIIAISSGVAGTAYTSSHCSAALRHGRSGRARNRASGYAKSEC
jgi:hypothetical protein